MRADCAAYRPSRRARYLARTGQPVSDPLAGQRHQLAAEKEGRQKGLRADLPGKLDYLWRTSNGNLQARNDLLRLQHVLHAVKMAGWIYMVLAEGEWSDRRKLHLSPSISGIYRNRNALDTSLDELGHQRIPLPARITGDVAGLDVLLQRSGWRREAACAQDAQLHTLLAEGFSAA